MNYFLEMFGYRERMSFDEYRNFKKRGHTPDKKMLPTRLMPANVEAEEVIRRVLLCNPPGMIGWRVPLQELITSWQITCPHENFLKLADKAARVTSALMIAENEKQKAAAEDRKNDGRRNN